MAGTKRIMIDPGHGRYTFPPSKGVYVNGKGYHEHNFNSLLANEVEKLLKEHGFNVSMYQKPFSDDIPLWKRTKYYNSQYYDLVWSIHANANSNPDVNGRCAFYWNTSKEGKRLAYFYADEIKKAGYSSHGDGTHASELGSWTNLAITREVRTVSVLTENGFMTGNKDFELVFGAKQKKYIQDMAVVHTKAICRFFGITYKGKVVKPKPTPKPPVKKEEGLTMSEAKKLQAQIDELKKLLANKADVKDKTNVAAKWATKEWKEAVDNGYFDGTRPNDYTTRQEMAVVTNKLRRNFKK